MAGHGRRHGAPGGQGGATPSPARVSNSALSRLLDACALFFGRACHMLGSVFMRALSTLVLLTGLVGTVFLQMTAYYYLGVLNPHPLIATLLYLPSLAAFAALRSELQRHGTSRASALGPPRESHPVTIAYLVMIVAAVLSLAHPVWMRSFNRLSAQSTWIAVAGTALFYYSILISEVLFAAAINLAQARRMGKRGGLYGAPYAAAVELGGGAAAATAPAGQPVAGYRDPAPEPLPGAPQLPFASQAADPHSAESGPIESVY